MENVESRLHAQVKMDAQKRPENPYAFISGWPLDSAQAWLSVEVPQHRTHLQRLKEVFFCLYFYLFFSHFNFFISNLFF